MNFERGEIFMANVITWLIMIFVISMIVLGLYARIAEFFGGSGKLLGTKCPKCGKRRSHAVSREEVKQEKITINKEEKIKHYGKNQINMGERKPFEQPESISIRKYTVPGIKTYYDVTYSCQICGETFIQSEYTENEV